MIRLLALLLAWLPVTAPAQTLAPNVAAALQAGLTRTADGFVHPAYGAQAETTGRLADALADGCGDLATAQAAYAEAFLAWQRASLIAIGPIADHEGPMRVQLWPDPKGFSARAVRAAIRAADPALSAPGGLEGRSIALTNLSALELLLFDAASDIAQDGYACDLARAIARFQADLAADLAAAWTPGSQFRASYDAAGADLVPTIRALLAGAVVQADRLRKFKLLRGLGTAPGEARPVRTEAAAAGLGLASIAESFRAFADFYEVPGGLFDAGADAGGALDYVVLAQTARSVSDTWTFEPTPLTEIAEDDGALAAELRRHADLVLYQEAFLKTGFLAALGLTAGFTAADGD